MNGARRHAGAYRTFGERPGGRAADGHEQCQSATGRFLTTFTMKGFGVMAEFEHLAKDRDLSQGTGFVADDVERAT